MKDVNKHQTYSDQFTKWQCGLILLDYTMNNPYLEPNTVVIGYNPMLARDFVDSICECFEIGVELDSYTDKE